MHLNGIFCVSRQYKKCCSRLKSRINNKKHEGICSIDDQIESSELLKQLYNPDHGDSNQQERSRVFKKYIRSINTQFCMASFSAKVNYKMHDTIKIEGKIMHCVKNEILKDVETPKFCEVYFIGNSDQIDLRKKNMDEYISPFRFLLFSKNSIFCIGAVGITDAKIL